MVGLIDAIIILFLLMGTIIGFKRGIFKSIVMFAGSIVVLILAYYFKTPVAEILYTYLPFFDLGGLWQGLEVFNILIYEALAFIIVYFLLLIILKLVIKVTGIFEKILNATIILGIPSKILGAIFGFLEEYVIIFLVLFILSHVSFISPYIKDSSLASSILAKTPLVSSITGDYYNSLKDIISLKDKYNNDTSGYNKEALDILIKNNIISKETINNLVKRGKLSFAKES